MAKAAAKVTKSTTVKAKNKINKDPKVATASSAVVARDSAPYTTTINPDSCNCKSQVHRPPSGGCKHIKAMKAAGGAAPSAPAAAAPLSSVSVNPESGLVGQGHVLEDGGEVYDNDLAYSDSAKNSNKFYKMQIVEATNKKKYWLVQNWGRVGTKGQDGLKDYTNKAECLKAFH